MAIKKTVVSAKKTAAKATKKPTTTKVGTTTIKVSAGAKTEKKAKPVRSVVTQTPRKVRRRAPEGWEDVLPVDVGIKMDIRRGGKALFVLIFDADNEILDGSSGRDFHWWSGTSHITYDFEAGQVIAVEAPFSAYAAGRVQFYEGDIQALMSLSKKVLWGSCDQGEPEDASLEDRLEKHLGGGQFQALARRIIAKLTSVAMG